MEVNGLDQKDIAARLLDLLAHVDQICSLFFKDFIHLTIVVHHNLVVHLKGGHSSSRGIVISDKKSAYVRFRRAELELNQADLGLLHSCRTAGARNHVLVEQDTFYKLSILNRSSNLLDDPHVA